MGEVSTIGLDIAKSVFQVHGVDVAGTVVIRKRCWENPVILCVSNDPEQLSRQLAEILQNLCTTDA